MRFLRRWLRRIDRHVKADPMPFVLVGGQKIYNAHSPELCFGRPCTVHHPSDHHMVRWPQNWRPDRVLMERICPHGVGHPDPDDINRDGIHGCDGCCAPPERPGLPRQSFDVV